MKTIQLIEGSEKAFRWAITMEIYPTSGFKAKGRIRTWFNALYNKPTLKSRVRHLDKMYFRSKLGDKYMKNFEVHHEWERGSICYLLSPKEHRRVHYHEV